MKSTRTLIAIAALAVVASACGGDDAGADGGVASIDGLSMTTTDVVVAADGLVMDEEAVLEFAECMREGGVDFPDPLVDADGNVGFDLMAMRDLADVDEADLEAAFEPCAPLLEGVNFGFDRIFDADFQDDLVVFSACMRDNGFDMPDPDFTALLDGQPLYPSFDLDDPDFEVAFEACQDTLPGIPGISTP